MSNLIYWDGTSLGPTSCFYWASKLLRGRFGQALKPSKPPQQLSKASALTTAAAFEGVPLALPWYLLGPTSCFYWASKLLRGTFWAGLQTLKTSAAAFEGLRTSQPSAAAFGHGTSLGPRNCFYWASKLLRGTFWASLKTLKTSAAAFEGLRTSQPSAAAFRHGTSLVPTSCFYWASKLLRGLQSLRSSFRRPENITTLRSSFRPWYLPSPRNCFYWASKLLRGTFWASLKTLKTSAAAFEGLMNLTTLRSSFPSWYLIGPNKLFLLGFETAMWHVFRQALNPSKPPQQLSKASEPHNPPQQRSAMVPP